MVLAALSTEEHWDLGLLGISVALLVVGIILARVTAPASNGVYRIVGPAICIAVLGVIAGFVYYARFFVKG